MRRGHPRCDGRWHCCDLMCEAACTGPIRFQSSNGTSPVRENFGYDLRGATRVMGFCRARACTQACSVGTLAWTVDTNHFDAI